jgi:hypothetical protein
VARRLTPVGAPQASDGTADHRKRLEALRDRLESAIEDAAHRDLAPLAARYQAVLSELAGLPDAEGSDGFDDLAARRRDRRSVASGS